MLKQVGRIFLSNRFINKTGNRSVSANYPLHPEGRKEVEEREEVWTCQLHQQIYESTKYSVTEWNQSWVKLTRVKHPFTVCLLLNGELFGATCDSFPLSWTSSSAQVSVVILLKQQESLSLCRRRSAALFLLVRRQSRRSSGPSVMTRWDHELQRNVMIICHILLSENKTTEIVLKKVTAFQSLSECHIRKIMKTFALSSFIQAILSIFFNDLLWQWTARPQIDILFIL